MIRRPPRSTRTVNSFPTRRSSDLDDMLHRGHHFLGESSMGDENHSEQRQCFIAGHAVDYPQDFPPGAGEAGGGLPSSPSCGAESRLRWLTRSEEHTSELQSLMRISYAVFCLKKKIKARYKQ